MQLNPLQKHLPLSRDRFVKTDSQPCRDLSPAIPTMSWGSVFLVSLFSDLKEYLDRNDTFTLEMCGHCNEAIPVRLNRVVTHQLSTGGVLLLGSHVIQGYNSLYRKVVYHDLLFEGHVIATNRLGYIFLLEFCLGKALPVMKLEGQSFNSSSQFSVK